MSIEVFFPSHVLSLFGNWTKSSKPFVKLSRLNKRLDIFSQRHLDPFTSHDETVKIQTRLEIIFKVYHKGHCFLLSRKASHCDNAEWWTKLPLDLVSKRAWLNYYLHFSPNFQFRLAFWKKKQNTGSFALAPKKIKNLTFMTYKSHAITFIVMFSLKYNQTKHSEKRQQKK